jgi:HPt (histidine-containing phosphotransfer) domain-containing protein
MKQVAAIQVRRIGMLFEILQISSRIVDSAYNFRPDPSNRDVGHAMVLNEESACVFDFDGALARVGGDEDLLREIGALFLQEFPPAISGLRHAVADRDPKRIERSAHSLKGSLSTFGTGVAFQATYELERKGSTGDLAEVESNLQRVEVSLARLCNELRTLISQ